MKTKILSHIGQYREDIVKVTLNESLDKEGKDWDVVIIEAGDSLNRKVYSPEVLKQALKLFEESKCFAYEFGSKFFNHLPEIVRNAFKKGFAKNLVGFFSNVHYGQFKDANGKVKEGILGKLHILESAKWLRKMLRDAWEHGKKNLLGLSIDGGGLEHRLPDGRKMVDEISVIDEVTLVTSPAAGGKFQRLVASLQGGVEMKELFKKLVEMLKESSPDIVEGLDPENLTEDQEWEVLKASVEDFDKEKFDAKFGEQAETAFNQLIDKIIDAVEKGNKADAIAMLKKIKGYGYPQKAEAEKAKAEAEVEAKAKAEKEAKEKAEKEAKAKAESENLDAKARAEKEQKEAEELKKKAEDSLKNIEKIEEATQKRECSVLLEQSLKDSKLPEPNKNFVREMFKDKIFKADDLKAEIKKQDDIMAKLVESKIVIPSGSVEVVSEERDKHALAMDGFFKGKNVASKDGETPVKKFNDLHEAYRVITGDFSTDSQDLLAACYGFKRDSNRLRESITTATFAQILGDSVTRKMIKDYKTPELNEWRLIVSEYGNIKDFRTQRRTLFGGYANLPGVAEAGPYNPLSSPGDDENTYAISKKGGTEDLTLETLSGDDVGLIKRIPKALGLAAIQTLYDAVFGLIQANVATTYDGTVLFHANHANTGTVALSDAGLTTAKTAMMSQAAYGNVARTLGMANKPKFLLVPNELEDLGFKLTTSAVYVGANQTETSPNIHSTYGLKVIVVPNWTDATDWALVADPDKIPTIEVGFYQGREDPELFVQDMPNVGSMFNNDKITYKIRHIWGLVLLNYRGFYKNTVAGS